MFKYLFLSLLAVFSLHAGDTVELTKDQAIAHGGKVGEAYLLMCKIYPAGSFIVRQYEKPAALKVRLKEDDELDPVKDEGEYTFVNTTEEDKISFKDRQFKVRLSSQTLSQIAAAPKNHSIQLTGRVAAKYVQEILTAEQNIEQEREERKSLPEKLSGSFERCGSFFEKAFRNLFD